jgi:hypothetical protein
MIRSGEAKRTAGERGTSMSIQRSLDSQRHARARSGQAPRLHKVRRQLSERLPAISAAGLRSACSTGKGNRPQGLMSKHAQVPSTGGCVPLAPLHHRAPMKNP